MKTITLEVAKIGKEDLPYEALIRQCVNATQPNQPISLDEQRRRLRILDALDALDEADNLVLEDEDAKHLAKLVETMPWAFVNKAFVTFSDDVIKECRG
ncbi:hypothetical protein [Maricaulis sp.]|uniref:hypothetical protein n=1 Tax=Maricaulis sp. TaxID=1486257 RepID=UPI00263888D9|nr:hypothetical protein [Maricaulis sp.]MDF1769856.1 hypothetical protein [Maricaulis sp.]